MRSTNLTLGAILTSPNQYVIPVFQRYYRWEQPQWDKLWTDLEDLRAPGKTGRHFMGFLVQVPETPVPGKITKYHLIDGQQRLTTLSILLCALRDVAKANGHTDVGEEIHQTCLVHPFKKGVEQYRLYPKQRDRDDYLAALAGQTPQEGRIGAALRYFAGRLTSAPGVATEAGLRAFLAVLTHRLEFIHATLEGENPFNIFKSLNSTGVPLGQADLIRNFVFMQVPVEDLDDFEAERWKPIERRFVDAQGKPDGEAMSRYLRDFLMQHGEYVSPTETFEVFQRRYSATDFQPDQLAAALAQASEWYQTIQGARPDPEPAVEEALAGLRKLDSATTSALVMQLYERRHRGELSPAGLAESLEMLSGFIFRRLVCGETSRAYARMFVQAAAALKGDPVGDLRRFLEARWYPDTGRFIESFGRFNLYKSRYCKTVLDALEREHAHKEPADLTKAQVEHIMPQKLTAAWKSALGEEADTIHATWLHAPGNLTLTGYNQEATNKPFADKKAIYADSHYVMTKRLAQQATWGPEEIEARGREMAEVAAGIWKGPAVPAKRGDGSGPDSEPSRFELRRRFWTGFREFMEAAGSDLDLPEPGTSYSLRCGGLGVGAALNGYLNLRNQRIAVSALFYGKQARHDFKRLQERKDEVEAAVGSRLVWVVTPEQEHGEILLRNPTDPTNEALWPTYWDWMRRSMEAIRQAVKPYLGKAGKGGPAGRASGDSKTRGQFLVEYWTAFRHHVTASGSPLRVRKPRPEHWSPFPVGVSGASVNAHIVRTRGELNVTLVLHGSLAKSRFHMLAGQRAEIERALGSSLEWEEKPGRVESHVILRQGGFDAENREDWPRQHEWLRSHVEAFARVFGPLLRQMSEAEVPGESQGEPAAFGPGRQLLIDYWTTFRDALAESDGGWRLRKPQPAHYYDLSIGAHHIQLNATVNRPDRWIAAQMSFWYEKARGEFEMLRQQREKIEEEAGGEFEWIDKPGNQYCQIRLRRLDVDPADRAAWPDQHAWLREKLELLRRVLVPKLRQEPDAEEHGAAEGVG